MTDQEIKKNNETKPVTTPAPVSGGVSATAATTGVAPANKVTQGRRMRDSASKGGHNTMGQGQGAQGRGQGRGGRSGGRSNERGERVKPEFDSKIIDIRRVTRVTSGGRRMNFSVAVVAGDRKGRVGVGLGKGNDTAGAVEKATREARKNLIKIPLSPQMTLLHGVDAKFSSARIMIFPARGRGIVAGSSARTVIELAGIKDVCAKLMSGSKNRLNIARVTIAALSKLSKVSRNTLLGKPAKVASIK